MKVVSPFAVTPQALVSSSIPELSNGEVAYASGTTYAKSTVVAYQRRRYESLQAANIGHQPDASPTWWLDIGPTNRWAMFDAVNGTTSQDEESIEAKVQTTGRVDSVALLNVDGSSVEITARAGDDVVYDRTFPLVDNSAITTYYDYFFAPVARLDDVVALDLPLYRNMEIDVKLTGDGNVSVGTLLMGQSRFIGDTLYGAKTGINDYSKKGADEFGNYTLVERTYSKRATLTVIIKADNPQTVATRLANAQKLLAGLRATPVLWVGSEDYGITLVYGFYKSFELEIQYQLQSVCSLEIEGLS